MRQQGSATIPFLLFVGTFVVCVTVFYGLYSGTAAGLENELLQMELEHQFGVGWEKYYEYGESVIVPVNYVPAYENEYGENAASSYYEAVPFVWSKSNTLFVIEAIHNPSVHDSDDLGITIMTIGEDNGWISAFWFDEDTSTDGHDLHVGKRWFRDLSVPWGLLLVPILGPGYITVDVLTGGDLQTVSIADDYTPQWPYNVEITIVNDLDDTRVTSGTDNFVYGYVQMDWDTYAASLGERIGEAASEIVNTVRGAFAGLFGFVFGDAGKEFVNTLSSALTLDLPGIPTPVRVLILIPLWLGIAFVLAVFIRGFIPFTGGGS